MLHKLLLVISVIGIASCADIPKTLNEEQHLQQQERCADLKEQIKKLEGKPVRRTTAREYYTKECLS